MPRHVRSARFVLFGLLAAALLTLAGCGGSKKPTGTDPPPDPTTAPTAAPEMPPPAT